MLNKTPGSKLATFALSVTILFFSTLSTAATWEVVAVLDGTDSGFTHSVLHTAPEKQDSDDNPTGAAPMSGTITDYITGVNSGGMYNDVTGALDVTFTLDNDSSETMKLTGVLDFFSDTTDIYLDDQASITADFSVDSRDTTLNFDDDDAAQCCSGAGSDDIVNPPNSFVIDGGFSYITLWGANGELTEAGFWSGSDLGIDLRIQLVEIDLSTVPVPAAFWLFGSALIGLAGLRRKAAKD